VTPRGGIYARQWVHASILSGGVTETSKVVDVLLLLGGKQHSYARGYMLCLHYTLYLMQLSIVRNLILMGVFGRYPREWIISHRCCWMVVYVSCCNAQSKSHSDPLIICTLSLFYQFPNYNLFTQLVLFYLMERHLWWTVDPGPISIILLSPVYFTRILLLFSTRYAHSFVSSKQVRLTTSS
jgi:hypothetical protein